MTEPTEQEVEQLKRAAAILRYRAQTYQSAPPFEITRDECRSLADMLESLSSRLAAERKDAERRIPRMPTPDMLRAVKDVRPSAAHAIGIMPQTAAYMWTAMYDAAIAESTK